MNANDQLDTSSSTEEREPVALEATVLRSAHTQSGGDTYVHLFLKEKDVPVDSDFSFVEKASRFHDLPLAQGLDTVSVEIVLDGDRNVVRLDGFRLLHPSLRLG